MCYSIICPKSRSFFNFFFFFSLSILNIFILGQPLCLESFLETDSITLPLRLTIEVQGRSINMNIQKLAACRAFGNKMWNAVKFFSLTKATVPSDQLSALLENGGELALDKAMDVWINARLKRCASAMIESLERFDLSSAVVQFQVWFAEKERQRSRKESASGGRVDR